MEQREIKFRVWVNNKMIYPHEHNRTCSAYSDICYYPNKRIEKEGEFEADDFKIMHAEGGWCSEWNGQMVMQFTGLKDKNGKDIYEGDIISLSSQKVQVEFYNGGFGWFYDKEYSLFIGFSGHNHFDAVMGRIEVIGNIYQNPKLINATK